MLTWEDPGILEPVWTDPEISVCVLLMFVMLSACSLSLSQGHTLWWDMSLVGIRSLGGITFGCCSSPAVVYKPWMFKSQYTDMDAETDRQSVWQINRQTDRQTDI